MDYVSGIPAVWRASLSYPHLILDGGDSLVQTERPFDVVESTIDFLESTVHIFPQSLNLSPQRAHLWRHEIMEELGDISDHTHVDIVAVLFGTLTRIEGLDPLLPINPARNISTPPLVY